MNKEWPKIPEGAVISGVVLVIKQEFGPLQDSTPFLEVAYFCNGKFEKKEFHTNGNAKEACSEAEAFRKYLLLLEKQNKPDTQSMRDEILEERSKISDIPER